MSDAAAGPFNVRVTAGLIAAAVLFAGVFAVLTAYGGGLTTGNDGGAHAMSRAGTGFSGVVALAPAAGIDSRISRSDRPGTAGLLVLTPPIGSDPAKIAALVKRRAGLPVLLVLPKWQTMLLPGHNGWVQTVGTAPANAATALLKQIAPKVSVGLAAGPAGQLAGNGNAAGLAFATPSEQRVVAGPQLVAVVAGSTGEMVLGWLPERDLYILADPDLIDNRALRTPAQAREAVTLLRTLGGGGPGGLVFDVTLNGYGRSQDLLRTMLEPPLLALTLALLIAAGLTLWQGAVRFGTPDLAPRAIAFGKRALVDNAAALIRMARREPALAERYAAQIRDRAAAALHAPPQLQGAQLVDWLDRRGIGVRFADLADAAAQATDRASALAAAHALYQWQQDVTHDPR